MCEDSFGGFVLFGSVCLGGETFVCAVGSGGCLNCCGWECCARPWFVFVELRIEYVLVEVIADVFCLFICMLLLDGCEVG